MWNYTIDDTSAMLTYQPYGGGRNPGDGWVTWFSGSGFNNAAGQASSGDSWHLTSLPGASVSLEFHGTSIHMYGNSSCPYEVSLDNSSVLLPPINTTNGGLLFSAESLPIGTHLINVTALPSQQAPVQLFFDRAIVTDILPSPATSIAPISIDNQNPTALHYEGLWTTENGVHIPSISNPKPFMKTIDSGASVSLNFTGAIAVAINGNRDWGHHTYEVSLDGVSRTYNASTFWLIGDTTLYHQSGLDPTVSHTISMTNGVGNRFHLGLNDFTLYTSKTDDSSAGNGRDPMQPPENGTSNRSPNVGVIIGSIIGSITVLVVISYFQTTQLWHSDISPYTLKHDDISHLSTIRPALENRITSPSHDPHPNSNPSTGNNIPLSSQESIPMNNTVMASPPPQISGSSPANPMMPSIPQYTGHYSLPAESMGQNVQALIFLTRINDQTVTTASTEPPPYHEV
ncbi:hypothetical protein C8Q75DRAFT_445092 [Abortiporus biennis]|nr:hypothetical protein C8Q75DRAFT_445092 [Abortiporus biennis]